MAGGKSNSPWFYFGCGCFGCVGLCVLVVIATGFFGASVFKGFVDDMKDPAARGARAQEILGVDELPAGYHARAFFRIPWILDMVILSDGEAAEITAEDLDDFDPFESGPLGEHVFFYLAVRSDGKEDFESIFEGRRRGRSGDVNIDLGSHFESFERLGEGTLDLGSQTIDYAAHRGELVTESGERIEGLYSQMAIGCSGSAKQRFAVWFERGEELGDGELVDLPGTPADESTLREFMGQFELCGG